MHSLRICTAFLLLSCASEGNVDVREVLRLPEHFETPYIPPENPPTAEKIELGRLLFYDERLSFNGTTACASCHLQEHAFADGRIRPLGATGEAHPRNSQGLANVAYFGTLTWANDGLRELETQLRVPLTSDRPIELGLTDGVRDEVLARLSADEELASHFALAFPDSDSAVTLNKVILALASFVRSMVSGASRYDRYLNGDASALTEQERQGLRLFNGERFECFHCHTGTHFTASYRDSNIDDSRFFPVFFNNGRYNLDGRGSYPSADQGLIELTGDAADMGAFRPPTLRNIELTAPYMHDGSLSTLREVLLHYAAGGTLTVDGPNAGDGRLNPNKSNFVRGFEASEEELAAVEAFLRTLTDWEFVTDPRFSDPHPE